MPAKASKKQQQQQKKKQRNAPRRAPAKRAQQPSVPRHVPTGNWVLGRSNIHPSANSPTAFGTQVCRTQHVYNRFVLTSSSVDGLACLIINPTMSWLTAMYGSQTGSLPTLFSVLSSTPATVSDPIAYGGSTGVNGQSLVGQYPAGSANKTNGTGMYRLLCYQVTYKLIGTTFNEGGIAFFESGSAGRGAVAYDGTALTSCPVSDRMAMPYSSQCPLSNKSHTVRMVPTLPDNQKFNDVPETLDSGNGITSRYIPDHINDFSDSSSNMTLVCQTAVPSQKIEFQIDAYYETYYIAPKTNTPLVPNTHVSLSDPVKAASNANSAVVADQAQLKNNAGGFVTGLVTHVAKDAMSAGGKMVKDLVTGKVGDFLMDGLKMIL